jgi:hypothetical protein
MMCSSRLADHMASLGSSEHLWHTPLNPRGACDSSGSSRSSGPFPSMIARAMPHEPRVPSENCSSPLAHCALRTPSARIRPRRVRNTTVHPGTARFSRIVVVTATWKRGLDAPKTRRLGLCRRGQRRRRQVSHRRTRILIGRPTDRASGSPAIERWGNNVQVAHRTEESRTRAVRKRWFVFSCSRIGPGSRLPRVSARSAAFGAIERVSPRSNDHAPR